MRTFVIVISIVLLPLYWAGAAFSSTAAPLPWSARGVFVFNYILLDFENNLESEGVGPGKTVLVNCSTPDFYCAYANVTHIALPRHCPATLKVGDQWTVNGVLTEVLNRIAEPRAATGLHAYGSGTVWLLGDPKFPHVVYEYDQAYGIRGFYYLATGPQNLVDLARTDPNSLKDFATRNTYFALITLDPFGKCDAA